MRIPPREEWPRILIDASILMGILLAGLSILFAGLNNRKIEQVSQENRDTLVALICQPLEPAARARNESLLRALGFSEAQIMLARASTAAAVRRQLETLNAECPPN